MKRMRKEGLQLEEEYARMVLCPSAEYLNKCGNRELERSDCGTRSTLRACRVQATAPVVELGFGPEPSQLIDVVE
jgi:hypothetical protein